MNNKSRFTGSMLATLMALMMLAIPVAGNAQETTTTIRGSVTAPDGTPAPGQLVIVTDTRTNSVRNTTTNSSGAFDVRGLPVGGPYTVRVQSAQYQDTLVTDVFTNLSGAVSFDLKLGASDEAIDEITTTAKMVARADLAVGPGTAFSLEDIESMPTIARQIRDVIRIDPRVSLGRADNGAGAGINCLGSSSRSNAFTIDGSLAIDGFGLNEGTGTSARFAFPIPFDTVASSSVEFAPLDVQYSQFTGCAINVVTKPGSNEFHGSAYYFFNDEGLTGDTLEGRTVISDPFEDTDLGFNFSGPIIKDKLFFFVAYEETDEGGIQNTGPIGGGFANEDFLTVAEAEQIAGVLLNQYGRDVGPIVRTLPQTSERTFARLDWNINDQHRAEFTYTHLEELNLDPDDLGFGGFTFRDNFEFEGIDQDTVSLRLFSNWTDNFSTEFRYSNFDVIDIQGPAGGGEAQDATPIVRIEVGDMLTSGPGFFRSANDLKYTIDQLKLSADWVINDHTLTIGVEQETRDVFNLFIPDATGTIVFADIAALEAGTASSIDMNGSFTQDPRDAAAAFERDINSFYLQDEWQVSDAVTVIAGLRFDQYDSIRDQLNLGGNDLAHLQRAADLMRALLGQNPSLLSQVVNLINASGLLGTTLPMTGNSLLLTLQTVGTSTDLFNGSGDQGVADRYLNYSSAGMVGADLIITPDIGQQSTEMEISASIRSVTGSTPQGTPMIAVRSIDSRVRTKDGETLILAGLRRTERITQRAGVPWLSDIPYLGYLFGGDTDIDRTTDVVITLDTTRPQVSGSRAWNSHRQGFINIRWSSRCAFICRNISKGISAITHIPS